MLGTESMRDKFPIGVLATALEVAYHKAGHRSAGKLRFRNIQEVQVDF